MAQIIKSISISKEEDDFLTENQISPSRIIQNKVQEMISFRLGRDNSPELLAKIQRLLETIEGYSKYLKEKGLLEEYCKYVE